MTAQNRKQDKLENSIELTSAQIARTLAADKRERSFLLNKALIEDSHFDSPKIHLLGH